MPRSDKHKKSGDWTERIDSALQSEKKSHFLLALLSFTESSFFIIPPDLLLIPLAYARKNFKKWALRTTLYSVLGGIFGYFIGFALFETAGEAIISLYSLQEEVARVGDLFARYEFITIFLAAFTPIPYKVFTISAGLFKVNLLIFIAASLLGRGLRFFFVAYLSEHFGPALVHRMKGRFIFWSVLFIALAILYFVLFQI